MPFSLEQEKFIIEAYFRNGERDGNVEWKYSPTLCAEEWINRFPDMEIDEETLIRHIHRIVHHFHDTGSVSKGKSSGRGTVLTEDVVADVRTCVERSPNKPLRQLAQQTGLSYGTAHKAVKKILHFHPYKVTVVQELLPPDYESIQYVTGLMQNFAMMIYWISHSFPMNRGFICPDTLIHKIIRKYEKTSRCLSGCTWRSF